MEDIIEYFTHPIIPKIEGKPTRDQIKEVQEKINNNVAVDSDVSGHYFITILLKGTKEIAYIPIQITLPDGSTISLIKTVILPEPK